LPPYSPELNPKENLWDEIREKIFKNYALKSIDAVRAKLKQAILYIERNPKLVQAITYLETRSENAVESMIPPFHPSPCAAPMATHSTLAAPAKLVATATRSAFFAFISKLPDALPGSQSIRPLALSECAPRRATLEIYAT